MDDHSSLDNIVLDFRFSEIEHELYSIEQHRLSVEAQLPTLLESERARMQEEASQEHEEDDWEVLQDVRRWVDIFVDYELPRLYRYPLLVSLWAVYESATKDISEELRKRTGHSLQIDDLKGDALERTNKYFEQVIKFPLVNDQRALTQLRMLLVLRNAIAHGNGRRDAIKQKTWDRIKSWNQSGISTDEDYLVFSAAFIQEMVKVVSNSLSDVIQRVKDTT